MLRGAWYALATPNPAFFGCDRFGLTAPVDVRLTPSFSSPVMGSNAGWTFVMGSAGVLSCSVVFRPVMPARLNALNRSARSWMVRLPGSRMFLAIDRSVTCEKHPRR